MRQRLFSVVMASVLLASSAWAQTPNTSGYLQNAAAATGNGTSLALSGYLLTAVQVSGTFVGTIVPEGSLDNTNWNTLTCFDPAGTSYTSFTGTGLFRCNTAGYMAIRGRVSAYTSGTITAVASASSLIAPIKDNSASVSGTSFTSPAITTGIQDSNNNQEVAFTATASSVNNLTIANAATGSGPALSAVGTDTNIPITLKGKGTGAVIVGQATSTDVRLAADQQIGDSSGNAYLAFSKTGSAVNGFAITNAATGNAPVLTIGGTGSDVNAPMILRPKGTGVFTLQDGSSNPWLTTVKTASAVNGLIITNAATGNAPILSPGGTGSDANASLQIAPKGTGTIVFGSATTLGAIRTLQQTVPTITVGGGTSPSVVGTDSAGIITLGTGSPASPFTLTFNGTWAAAPACTIVAQTTAANSVTKASTTATTMVVTLAAGPTASDKLAYVCIGVQ